MIDVEKSSDLLANQVESAIAGSPYLAKRKVRFETQDGRVVLRGTVSSYFQKQMAQEALRSVSGVREIDNLLEVNWS